MNYQLKGTSVSILVHAAILSAFLYASSLEPIKKKVISLDFSIVENIQPTASKGENKVAEAKKVKAVKPKPKPVEKKKIVKKVEKKEVALPKPEPVVEKQIVPEVEEIIEEPEVNEVEEVIEAETDESSVEEEVLTATNNLESNSLVDNSAAASQARYVKNHFLYIKEKIQKQIVYPRIARRRGIQGKTVISFVIQADGSVKDLKIVESSGYDILDRNAIKTVKRAAPFPKPPVSAELVIPMTFRLS